MRMQEVKTEADKKAFLQVAVAIYRNDLNWIRPLDKDIDTGYDENCKLTGTMGVTELLKLIC